MEQMRLSKAPNIGGGRALVWTALAVTLIAAGALSLSHGDITTSLGDTDDAMRLVLVRHLARSGGWYDQLVTRLQPPFGVYMHWSRLLDGALAGLIRLLSLALSPSAAELTVRFVWPLLLIAPAVVSGLVIIRRLGGEAAVLVGAVLMLADMELFGQFRPGRIDHHNVQIVMTLIAAACAVAGGHRQRAAIGAGVATALGLAIGVEALPFLALIGASYALGAVLDPRLAPRARVYGLALAIASTVFFTAQTPPWRWSLSACDAIGLNLVAALVVGGLGLALVGTWAAGRILSVRAALTGLVGAVTLGVYLGMDPACVHGPLAAVDPRLRPIWFDGVQELLAWPRLLQRLPRDGLRSIAAGVIALAAAGWLVRLSCMRTAPMSPRSSPPGLSRRPMNSDRDQGDAALANATLGRFVFLVRRDKPGEDEKGERVDAYNGASDMGPDALMVALVIAGVLESALVYRAEDYALWFGVPVLAVALSDLARRAWAGALLPTVVVALAASPVCVAAAAGLALPRAAAPTGPAGVTADHCLDNAAFGTLARLPRGIVLGEIDLGSYILADTPHSVISAPYHRMTWGILSAHEALAAPTAQAAARVMALKADYIVVCPVHAAGLAPRSLGADLARGATPPWLETVSGPADVLKIYRVRAAR